MHVQIEIADGPQAGSRFELLPAAHLSNIECRVAFNRVLNDFLK